MTHRDIDRDRLWQSLQELAAVGAFVDERTQLHGVNRLALSEADRDGRNLLISWFQAAGMHVRIDRIGNIFARRDGTDPTLPAVMCGSHADSVPTGGAFDGALGILGALEVVRCLGPTPRSFEIAVFTEEEGVRFGTDMLGSAVACGRIALEDAHRLADRDGVTVAQALRQTGFLGEERVPMAAPHAYLELHIEQGPILARGEHEVGIVTGVQGISWWEVDFHGRAAHAGTTPMELRRDAGRWCAELNLELGRMVDSGEFGPDFRATMGHMALDPGRINVVPRAARCTVDLRHPDETVLQRAEAHLQRFLARYGEGLGRLQRTARTSPVAFDNSLQERIGRAAEARKLRHTAILSGAGHDAQELAAVCPAAMVFVPGMYDGISHNPREYSTPEACAAGCSVLLDVVSDLLAS